MKTKISFVLRFAVLSALLLVQTTAKANDFFKVFWQMLESVWLSKKHSYTYC